MSSVLGGELMCLHVGQCGNQIGQSFWKTLCDEHAIDSKGNLAADPKPNDNKNVFFYQADDDHYVPRAVLVDLEPRVINGIRQSNDFGNLFNPDNLYVSETGGGAGNNWASGHQQGSLVWENILDMMDREAENCERMDGFLFTHSVSGGTGSGMGSLLLEKLRDRYPKKLIQTYSVFANQEGDAGDVVVHPYNSVLSLQRLIEYTNDVIVLDNAALNRLVQGKFQTQKPTFEHINSLVTRIMSTSTATLRFNSPMLARLRTFVSPYAPMHFIQAGFSPVVDPNQAFTRKTSVTDIMRHLLKPTSMMVSTAAMTQNSETHCMLSGFLLLQGQYKREDVNSVYLARDHAVNAIRGSPWDAMSPLRVVHAPSSPYIKAQYKVSGLMLNNSTSIAPLFQRILHQFTRLRSKNAFIDRFQREEGFDVSMMDLAAERVNELIDLYAAAEKQDFLI